MQKVLGILDSESGPKIIHHPDTPGNILYAGNGKQCLRCKGFYSCSHDFELHEKVCRECQWKKSNYGDEVELCLSSSEPELTHACTVKGVVRNGLHEYTLSQNGKWLKRKRVG